MYHTVLSKLDTSGTEQHQISGCLLCDLIFPDLNQETFLTLKYNPINYFHKQFKRIWYFFSVSAKSKVLM